MNIALKTALLSTALAFAGQAYAAIYSLDLTGTVSSGTSANVTFAGHRFDFFSISLSGFDPLTLVAGDEVRASITLDQSLTVPSAFFRNGTRLFLINSSYPATSTGVSGTTEFFNGGSPFLLSPSGGGTSGAVANQYNNALGNSFTFDFVQSNFIVDSLSDPSLFVDRAVLDYFLDNPAMSGVPEPASWALMLGGFGLVGTAMRRRTRMTVTYA
jgi:PEP-CTERM motif